MYTQKDSLIAQLKRFIENDSQWLTRSDIESIHAKIDELDRFINQRYQSHKIVQDLGEWSE